MQTVVMRMKVDSVDAIVAVNQILSAGLVPMLHGSPGSSKSSIAQQVAKDKNLFVIDFRVSTKSPEDFSGFPFPDKETKKAAYMAFDTFPIEGDTIPDGYSGWLIILEEINSASLAIQAACYQLILDRAVGQDKLHKNVYMIACGNLITDRAIVNRMGTAMQSRLIHLEVALTPAVWIDWANKNKLDHRVIGFIGTFPKVLDTFDPDHNDFTFTCGRTWEFVSKLITPWDAIEHSTQKAILSGTVGKGPAQEFITYCKIYKKLPTISQIVNDPENTSIPEEPSICYAITNMLATFSDDNNLSNVFKYIIRLPMEFQIICIRAMLKRNPVIQGSAEWHSWITTNANLLV